MVTLIGLVATAWLLAGMTTPPLPQATTCATLLTAAELTKAAGGAMESLGLDERGPGATECGWMARGTGGFRSVSVQFHDLKAIAARESESTPDAFFEWLVAGDEMVGSSKREAVPNAGQKAAFVQVDAQMTISIQRPDGVARIVTNNLTKAQVIAVGRAVAD